MLYSKSIIFNKHLTTLDIDTINFYNKVDTIDTINTNDTNDTNDTINTNDTNNKLIINSNINYNSILQLNEYKNNITNISNWNSIKKINNNYELLNIIINNNNESIVKYKPLSRSFYKLWEMIYDYKLINLNNSNYKIICIAEAPGGFIDAFNKYFINNKYTNYTIYGHSLIDNTNKDIPSWYNAYNKFYKNNNIHILSDTDGNLYNVNNLYYYNNLIHKHSCDIVTADGGFDFSENYNLQESLFYKLFFSEILLALSLQKKGGIFICKCFDLYSEFSQKLLYILYILYDSFIFTKPSISRDTNSEKYIILKGFKGINDDILNNMYKLLINWDINNLSFNLPSDFKIKINEYNNYFIKLQLNAFKKTHELINSINIIEFTKIIKKQIDTGINFCNKYNLYINHNSIFFKLNNKILYYYNYLHI